MKASDRFALPRPAPWEGAAASLDLPILPRPPDTHPCADCLAMCCWFVLVETGQLEGIEELDAISDHLDYARMVVWIQSDGEYTLGLVSPCHYFDRASCGCTVHGTAAQPDICQRFDARVCWYRAHYEPDSPLNWARLDGRSWPAFRRGIGLTDDDIVDWLPAPRGLDRVDRRYEVPALLQFDIPDDVVDDPAHRGDLLYFLSNFAGVELVRTPEAWHFLYETHRDAAAPPRDIEVIDGRIGGFPADVVRRLTRAEVHGAWHEHGPGLWDLRPEDLRLG